ncbi:MAG: phenylacetate--CoA ligase family protein [Nitratireductor sp.]|nr:phenylacetate--CoA ligase family protein [Nitratireductor sp.]
MPGPEVTAFLNALNETEHLAPERMLAYQRRLLARLLPHAARETGFYRDRLSPVLRNDGTFDWERWNEIPILMRSDLQDSFDQLVARNLPKSAGGVNEDVSSGSTGSAVRHLNADLQNFATACCNERFFAWHGIDPGALYARIRITDHPDAVWPNGRRLEGWRIAYDRSVAIDLSTMATMDQQIEWLERIRPRYLMTYPSILRTIASEMAGRQKPLRFDAVLSFGEMLTEDARRTIEDGLGVHPLDRYGTGEVGHISAVCPQHLKHHISSELVLVEIVDEQGQEVPAGTEGRVIVTPFYSLAMPLIRYDIGDYAVLSGEPCSCGRSLPVFERILGRSRNVFRSADGRRIWPAILSSEIGRHLPNRQFQIVQLDFDHVEIRYVPMPGEQTSNVAGLTAYVRERLQSEVKLSVQPVDAIERSAGGKYEDFKSMLD